MLKPRGRPKRLRVVQQGPKIVKFSPRGKPGRPEEIEIKIDEFEALRLADYLGLKQAQAASSMQVSQQTFSRILKRARKALSDAFVNGKMIRVSNQEKANF